MIQAINTNKPAQKNTPYFSVPETMLPQGERNYCLFNRAKVDFIILQKENALPHLKEVLQTSKDEKEIVETLYIIDRMIDGGTKVIPAMYPYLAKFNDTRSPNIQAFLAGIYRKTQVPDAFGPLVKMLIKNSQSEIAISSMLTANRSPFDPNEEIGGAILEYIRNYSNNHEQIDYTA